MKHLPRPRLQPEIIRRNTISEVATLKNKSEHYSRNHEEYVCYNRMYCLIPLTCLGLDKNKQETKCTAHKRIHFNEVAVKFVSAGKAKII